MKTLLPLSRSVWIGLGPKVRHHPNIGRSFTVSVACDGGERQTWGTTKKNRSIKLLPWEIMADPKIEEALAPLRAAVKEQVSFICEKTLCHPFMGQVDIRQVSCPLNMGYAGCFAAN